MTCRAEIGPRSEITLDVPRALLRHPQPVDYRRCSWP